MKLNYLNLGCGNKYHKEWINLDMSSNSKYVKSANLLKGIPFESNKFDVVYHSQVLEHFPKEKAGEFIKECYRVLKPGGILRVVVPDLENIAKEYLKFLNENVTAPTKQSQANYEWILLEMFDQTVRNNSGGQMAEYLKRKELVNEKYVINRIGYVAKKIKSDYLLEENKGKKSLMKRVFNMKIKNIIKKLVKKVSYKLSSEKNRIGRFRLGGEIHMWMYDRFSLTELLKRVGFEKVEVKTPHESDILNWFKYELDVKNGEVYDPTSLFIETRKPLK